MKHFAFLLFFLGFAPLVSAHPHSFLDIQNQVQILDGKLSGFKLSWTLDEITSAELLYEIKTAKDQAAARKKIQAEMDSSAVEAHYFSELYDEKKQPIKFKNRPQNSALEIKGNRVIYHFTLPVAQPVAVAGKSFQFYTFEPSYYLAMEYNSTADLTATAQTACRVSLVEPQVSQDIRLYASKLDKSENPDVQLIGGSLGAMFAQKVQIECK